MGYNINGVYWSYNPFTDLLPACMSHPSVLLYQQAAYPYVIPRHGRLLQPQLEVFSLFESFNRRSEGGSDGWFNNTVPTGWAQKTSHK